MATRVTFIIRDDEAEHDPSVILETVQQMLGDQMDRYSLGDNFDDNDVMVQAHPEGAPVGHIEAVIDALLTDVDRAAAKLAKSARALVAEERIKDRTPPHHYSEAHRAILQLASTIDGEG